MPRSTRTDLWKPLKIGKRTYRGAGKEGQWCLVRRVLGAVEFFTVTEDHHLLGLDDEATARGLAALFNRSASNEELLEAVLEAAIRSTRQQ